jgi:hypothetical protein
VGGGRLQAIGISNIKAMTYVLGREVRVKLKNILLVPSFGKNLVLNHQVLYSHGCKWSAVFENGGATVYNKATGKVLLQAINSGVGIPVVKLKVKTSGVEDKACAYTTVTEAPNLLHLHCHFNHTNKRKLHVITHQLSIPIPQGARLPMCASCMKKCLWRQPVGKGPAPRAK